MGFGSWETVPGGEKKLFVGKSAFRRAARLLHAARGQVPLNRTAVPNIGRQESKILNERPHASTMCYVCYDTELFSCDRESSKCLILFLKVSLY